MLKKFVKVMDLNEVCWKKKRKVVQQCFGPLREHLPFDIANLKGNPEHFQTLES
jgi:hypothetical protein